MKDEIKELIDRNIERIKTCYEAAARDRLVAVPGEHYCIDIDAELKNLKFAVRELLSKCIEMAREGHFTVTRTGERGDAFMYQYKAEQILKELAGE